MNHPALALFVFLAAVYGLSTSLAVLKIGQFMFGKRTCPNKACTHPKHPAELRRFLGRVPGLGDLFYCPPCLAFWIGVTFSVFVLSPAALVVKIHWVASILDGLMACGVVYLIHAIVERLIHLLDDL